MEQGKQIFRYDTFGDKAYWSGQLKLHQAIQGSRFGDVGPGICRQSYLNRPPGTAENMGRLTADDLRADHQKIMQRAAI
jgi:hypothetical protein